MTDPIRLHEAGLAHAELLSALQQACFPDDPWSPASVAETLAQPGAVAFVATVGAAGEDGEPAGFVIARAAGEDGEILAIGVTGRFRRRGLGRRLVDAGVDAAIQRGATAVFLEVAEDNAEARALYAAKGFAPVGRRPDYYRRPNGRAAAVVLRRPFV